MNMKKLSVVDIINITRSFVYAEVRSEKLYKQVVRYIQKIDSNKKYLETISSD